jgi:dTDP-glucose pyrophosphorylase/predicted transcriptional regulator
MGKAIQEIFLGPGDTIQKVLATLQDNPYGICLVLDDQGKILGTITDGDCRRALLRENSLNLTASDIMHREFVVVDKSFSLDQIRTLMARNGVNQIPIVDEQNVVLDIATANRVLPRAGERSTTALILAGGKGQRLRPLTDALPKPMLPIGGRPMLEHLVIQLVAHGFHDLCISINYLGHVIEEYFGDGTRWDCNIRYVREDRELGTGGPLRLLPEGATSPVLVVNGDLVTSVDFEAFLNFHGAHANDITVATTHYSVQVPFGVVYTDERGRVTHVEEKPRQSYSVNAGLYLIERDVIELIPPDRPYGMTELIESALAAGRSVGAFALHELWADVGLPDQYHALKDKHPSV